MQVALPDHALHTVDVDTTKVVECASGHLLLHSNNYELKFNIGQPIYDANSLLAMGDVYSVLFQETITDNRDENQPFRKNAFSGIPTQVHPRLPGLTLTSVATW